MAITELRHRALQPVLKLLVAHDHALPLDTLVDEPTAAANLVELAEVLGLAATALLRPRPAPVVLELALRDRSDPTRERRPRLDLELADAAEHLQHDLLRQVFDTLVGGQILTVGGLGDPARALVIEVGPG